MKSRATLPTAILAVAGLAFTGGVVFAKLLLDSPANATHGTGIPEENIAYNTNSRNPFSPDEIKSICETFYTETDPSFRDSNAKIMENRKILCGMVEAMQSNLAFLTHDAATTDRLDLQSELDLMPPPGVSFKF